MSSTAPSANRLPRVAPRVAQRALQRARLTVVPRPLAASRAPRVPFVMLISALLLGGVLGLLLFNTSMQQASFRETALTQQARDLAAQQEALQLKLDQLADPHRIARQAQRMGMVVPSGGFGFLNYETGKITGAAQPADGTPLPLRPPPARKPPALRAGEKSGAGADTSAGTGATTKAPRKGPVEHTHGASTRVR